MATNVYDVLDQVQDVVDAAVEVVEQTTETQRILHKNRQYVDPKISTHNEDPKAHEDIRGAVASMTENMPSMITPPEVTGPSAVESGESGTWVFSSQSVISTVTVTGFTVVTSDGETFDIPATNGSGSFTHTFTGTRNQVKFFNVTAYGSYDFTSKVVKKEFTVTIHLPPTMGNMQHTLPAVISHGQEYTFQISGITDPDDDLAQIDLTYDNSKITLSKSTDITQGEDITLTCGNIQGGSTTITVTATDDKGMTNTASIVLNLNQDPVAANISHTYPTKLNANSVNACRVSGFTDPDGDTVTYSIASSIPEITFSKSTGIAANEDINVTVGNVASNTAYTLTLTFTDPHGGTTSAIISSSINNPPNMSGFVGTVASRLVPGSSNNNLTLSGATDADGDTVVYSLSNIPTGFTFSKTTNIAENETITFSVPASAVRGQTYSVTVTATDSNNATNTGTVDFVINTLPNVNSVACTLPDTVAPDTDYTISFSGATDVDGQTLSYTPSSTAANVNSAADLAANATFTLHTPTAASVARGSTWDLVVTVSDGLETASKTFTYTQNELPDVTNLDVTTSVDRLVVGQTATISFSGATD